jgi:8-oxo-dGTP diphosphatase
VAAVLVDDLTHPTRVLAARRSTPAALAGRWEFPGGKVEPEEDPVGALRRELREELGIEIVVGAELPPPSGTAWAVSDALELRCWWAGVGSGEPVATDAHDDLRWLSAAELAGLDWLDADLPIAATVRRRMSPAL